MKQRVQGMVTGFLVAILLFGVTAYAATGTQNIAVIYRDIKLYIDGVLIIPKDANGSIIEPFIYNGTTYLPVRALGEAFGKSMEWDGNTNSVYIGGRANKPAVEVPLYNKPYLEIGDSSKFNVKGNEKVNFMKIIASNGVYIDKRCLFTNYVVYPLNMTATKFKAVLNPPHNNSTPELIYRVYGDGEILYTSPIFTPFTAPQSVNIEVSGVMQLKIEVELTSNSGYGDFALISGDYKGIENAVIVTTDY